MNAMAASGRTWWYALLLAAGLSVAGAARSQIAPPPGAAPAVVVAAGRAPPPAVVAPPRVAAVVPAKVEPTLAAKLKNVTSVIASLVWLGLLIGGLPAAGWLLVKEWRRDALVIEPFDMPNDLQDLGLSGVVLSQLLSDHVLELQRSARLDDDPADIVFVELPKMQIDLQLPGMSWSVRGVIRYLKQATGQAERRLLGEVVRKRSTYAIRLRLTSGRARDVPQTFHGGADLEAALKSAARVAVALMNPFEAASIHYSLESYVSGYVNTIESLQQHLALAPAAAHQDAYVLWASVHRALGQFDAMQEKLRLAEMAGARLWRGELRGRLSARYHNFVGSLRREALEAEPAERAFKAALRLSRKKPLGAMTNLGLLYFDLWRLDEARHWFSKVVRNRPNSSRGYRGLGLVAMRDYRLDEALRFFARAIDVAPLARWPRINQLEALRRKGDYPAALAAVEAFKQTDAGFAPFLRGWGDLLIDMGDLPAALSKYRQAIVASPFDAWGYVGQANALGRSGMVDEAEASALRALELRPNLPGATLQLVEVHSLRGDGQQALEMLRRLVAAHPHELYAGVRLFSELRRKGQFDEAERCLAALPAHIRQAPEGLREQGWLAFDKGDYRTALAQFRRASERACYDPWAHLAQAEVLRSERAFDAAIAAVERALECRPTMAEAYRKYGEVLDAQNDGAGAERKLNEAIRLDPYDPYAHVVLAGVLRRSRRFDEAQAAIATALRLRPNLPAALRGHADLLRDLENWPGAERQYRAAIAAAAWEPWSHLGLADLLLKLDRGEEALAAAHVALALRPNLPRAQQVVERAQQHVSRAAQDT